MAKYGTSVYFEYDDETAKVSLFDPGYVEITGKQPLTFSVENVSVGGLKYAILSHIKQYGYEVPCFDPFQPSTTVTPEMAQVVYGDPGPNPPTINTFLSGGRTYEWVSSDLSWRTVPTPTSTGGR